MVCQMIFWAISTLLLWSSSYRFATSWWAQKLSFGLSNFYAHNHNIRYIQDYGELASDSALSRGLQAGSSLVISKRSSQGTKLNTLSRCNGNGLVRWLVPLDTLLNLESWSLLILVLQHYIYRVRFINRKHSNSNWLDDRRTPATTLPQPAWMLMTNP